MANIGELEGKIILDTKGVHTALDSVDKKVALTEQSFNKLALAGTAMVAAVAASVTLLGSSAARSEDAMRGFARSFGDVQYNLDILREAAKGTVDDTNLMLTANKAALLGISNNTKVLAELMTTARLRGKEMGISTTQAFDDIVKGIGRGSPLILDNLGIQIPEAIKRMGDEVDDATKKQALLQAVIEDGRQIASQYGGDVATAADRMQAMAAEISNTKEALGSALVPIMEDAIKVLMPFVKMFQAYVQQNPEVVGNIVKTVAVVGALALAIGVAGKAFVAFTTVLKIVRAGLTATQLAAGLLGVAMIALGALLADAYMKQVQGAGDVQGANDDLSTSLQDLGSTGQSVADAMGGSFDDAAKKIRDVQEAIKEENEAFEQQLAEIVRKRKENIDTNKKLLAEEQREFEKKQKEMTKVYAKQTEDMEKQHDQRLADLEKSMAESLIVGSETYETDKANFEAALEEEKKIGEEQMQELQAQQQEETSSQQQQYDERTSALQAKISEDEALLLAHAELIKGINLDVKNDEIQQLIDGHQKRITALNEQLTKEQGMFGNHMGVLGSQWTNFVNNANAEKFNITDMIEPIDWGKLLGDAATTLGNLVKKVLGALAIAFVEIARGIAKAIRSAVESIPVIGGEIAKHLNTESGINTMADQMITDINKWSDLVPQYANGTNYHPGGMAIVGERGPEILSLPAGSRVMPSEQSSKIMNTANDNREIIINNNISPGVDHTSFMLRLERSLRSI